MTVWEIHGLSLVQRIGLWMNLTISFTKRQFSSPMLQNVCISYLNLYCDTLIFLNMYSCLYGQCFADLKNIQTRLQSSRTCYTHVSVDTDWSGQHILVAFELFTASFSVIHNVYFPFLFDINYCMDLCSDCMQTHSFSCIVSVLCL